VRAFADSVSGEAGGFTGRGIRLLRSMKAVL
jgi:hypothetical protein